MEIAAGKNIFTPQEETGKSDLVPLGNKYSSHAPGVQVNVPERKLKICTYKVDLLPTWKIKN